MRRARVSLLILALSLVACGSDQARDPRIPVTVVLTTSAESLESHLKSVDPRIEVTFAKLPVKHPAATPEGTWAGRISEARRAYVNANFEHCQEQLAMDPNLDETLTKDGRSEAQRVLFWRIACAVGAGANAKAKQQATAFAAFEFVAPPDVDSASPDVEVLLTHAAKTASHVQRASIEVEADVTGASVWLDGRPDVCRTPCSQAVLPGAHVVEIHSDGLESLHRLVQVASTPVKVSFATTPATPELAAEQWSARYAGGAQLGGAAAMQLLQIAIPSKRLVLFERELSDLRGALVAGGRVEARAERRATGAKNVPNASRSLMRELLVDAGVLPKPAPLYKRASFWIGVAAAAVVGAGITTALLYDPPVTTSVVLK